MRLLRLNYLKECFKTVGFSFELIYEGEEIMSFVENKISSFSSLSIEKYFEEYKPSIDNPENFDDKASSLSWIKN